MQKKHFILDNRFVESHQFTPRTNNVSRSPLPDRNRFAHAKFIKEKYQTAISDALSRQDEMLRNGEIVADGVYLDIEIKKNHISNGLDSKKGAQLLRVSAERENGDVDVTVFVKRKNKDWLTEKVDAYQSSDAPKSGEPSNNKLIAPIENISKSDVYSLFDSIDDFDSLLSHYATKFELWISKNEDYTIEKISSVFSYLHILCNVCERLQFDDVDVFLIETDKETLASLPNHLAYIEGMRLYKQPSVLIESPEVSREWGSLLSNDVVINPNPSVIIGVLDTGVNNAHELLRKSLPNDKMSSAINVKDNIDNFPGGHGTMMAGTALYGDLTDLAYHRGTPPEVNHALLSVKIYESGHESDNSFYGAIIEDAISQAQLMGATIDCMAITDDISLDGRPTSSSAALDESIYNGGTCDRLVLVSAGNIQTSEIDPSSYIESSKANAIYSPSQAWNALTVGAYTEKSVVSDSNFIPLASPGHLSPMSRTTYMWENAGVKPEIVMEGGNVALHKSLGVNVLSDLSLISTSSDLKDPLILFNATSAATALAARLAAKIQVNNPSLSALSVRALMVHSANWTPAMLNLGGAKDIMPLCGYGVPDERLALFSSDQCATFVFENELIPFSNKGGSNKYNELHYYDLPWPKELLENMHDENVTMRVTLSYYIKPAPGNASKNNKYRYPSVSLHFDVKTAIESDQDFFCRRNKLEGDVSSSNDSKRWKIGQQRRENGTVQSDWFTCTAQELAACGKIVVYPSGGWWKERKLDNVDNRIKYSLVVSIKTSRTEIYQAVATEIENRIAVKI